MADEADRRQVTEEAEAKKEENGEPQELQVQVKEEGDRSPVTVDSVVEAFFASEGGPENVSGASGKHDDVSHQDQINIEWSSDDEKEVRTHAPDAHTNKIAVESEAQPVGEGGPDSENKPPEDDQQNMAEAEHISDELERENGKIELSGSEPAPTPEITEDKRDSDNLNSESADNSADEDGADSEGSRESQDSLAGNAPPLDATAALLDNGHGTDQDEEVGSKDGKDIDEDQTKEAHFQLGHEPVDVNTVDDLEGASGDREGVHMVAQDLVHLVLDRVMKAEADTHGENARDEQETDTKADIGELDKVDINNENQGHDGLAMAGSSLDNASLSLSDADIDREQDIEKLMSDSEKIPEVYGDMKDVETGSDGELQACEGERELQGESQQMYQYSSDHSQSAPSSPHSQGEMRSMQQGNSMKEHGTEHRASPRAEYPLNVDNYRVCRMLSPGVKECLILETGEQVVYDCNSHDLPITTHHQASQPAGRRSTHIEKEKVKRNLFADGVKDTKDKPTVPASAHSDATERSPSAGHSLPQQSSSSTQDCLLARGQPERHQEADGSHDGSYLWLQRQVQWRAGSSEMPTVKGVREGMKDHHVISHHSGYEGLREERRGDVSSNQDISQEGRLGLSASASADISGSVTSPGAIPNFNTLRDQQVSWLSMYRMLEEQHRTELKAQYAEHQQMISDMQQQLERELLSQQQSMRQKLNNHREALRESSSPLHSGFSKTQGSSGWYNKRSVHTPEDIDTLQLSGQLSPLQHKEAYSMDTTFQERPSQRLSRDSIRTAPEISRDKRLRGGVYSSPMPSAKFRSSLREKFSYEADSREAYSATMTSEGGSQRQEEDDDSDSRQPTTQILSPRTHQSLREKHAKHLSDLRSYYEAEIHDLRQKLTAEGLRPSSSSASAGRELARERILQEENQMLRLQLRDLQDSLDDSQIYSRDLEQKIQGLEIRAADYAKRYEESQNTVLKLKNRLEELHAYAKDRESVLEQVQANEQRQAAALQEMYRTREELEETARRDAGTIKRLLDKYEMLEKDYSALKETSTSFEQKLFDTRSETVQLNKSVSQLELENKRLTHDNDNMRHRLALSGSLPLTRQELAETGHHRDGFENVNGYIADSTAQTHSARINMNRDRTPPRRVGTDEDAAAQSNSDSPLLRAERELKRLQQTMDYGEFIPHLQPKRYTVGGSLCGSSGDITIIDALSSPAKSNSSVPLNAGAREGARRGKKAASQPVKRDRPSGLQSKQPVVGRSPHKSSLNGNTISSPTRFDVGVPPTNSRSPVGVSKKVRPREAAGQRKEDLKPAAVSVCRGSADDVHRVDTTLERVRSGEFVSRPQWEDVYTSLAKPPQSDKAATINMTQEEMLRDRVRSIQQVERRYDALQVEKRQLESQLNKVPAHGRDRKSRREKELLEEKLDSVDHELGSLRMTLKRYQVLKTTM
ncbi:uncharacterized protein LOC143288470 isoform X1 [Babylonia areolata]|uniref:uncharacterized protein LOC143288470 isoform X1 n=1 Tax=Babylonia areolata TaxID=304850 RepID=UPI003FD3F8F3